MIQKREDRIGHHDMKLHRLQQQTVHIEKRKYVLDYQTKSLMERIEPIDQDVQRLKTNNAQLEQQLTQLKEQQIEIQQREKNYQSQFVQSSKKLIEAKKTHQQLEKILRGYRGPARQTLVQWVVIEVILSETIKKAYDSTVISCSSPAQQTEGQRHEQVKKHLQTLCRQLQDEEQTEDQLEMEGAINEWNRQRRWLLAHVRHVFPS